MTDSGGGRSTDGGSAVHFGVKWMGISLGAGNLLRLGVTVVLARLLTREDFGLVTMALTTIFAMSAFREVGFSQALIHRKDRGERDLQLAADTVFWILICANGALFLAGWIAAPWLATYFEKVVGLTPVLRAMLGIFLLEGLTVTPATLLQKRLEFGVSATIEMAGTLGYALVAILCAALGMGVWSLVVGQLVERAVRAVLLMRAAEWRPGLQFRWRIAKELFDYGKWLWGSAFLQAFHRSVDKLFMGKIAGGASLGSYGVAFNLCTAPSKPTGNITNRIAFPAFARIQDDLEAVATSYARTIAMLALVAFPAAVGLASVAPDFVVTVYGGKWSDMAPLIQVLAFYGMALSVGTISRPLLLALGRPGTVMWVVAGREALLLGLLLLLGRSGAQAIAWAVLIPTLTSCTVGLILGARVARCPAAPILGPLARTTAASLVMMLAVMAVRSGLAESWHVALRLVTSIVVGVGVYTLVTLAVNRELLLETLRSVRQILRSKGRLT